MDWCKGKNRRGAWFLPSNIDVSGKCHIMQFLEASNLHGKSLVGMYVYIL